MKLHFNGVGVCPAAGMTAAETIGERLLEVEAQVWEDLEAELLSMPQLPGSKPMSSEDYRNLISDLHCAKAHGGALFKVKTNYLRRIPWLFVGLAHMDEDKARSIGVQCLSQWEIVPRESVHHVITWDLMRPGLHWWRGST